MISVIDIQLVKSEVLDYGVITSAYGRRKNNLQNLIDKSKIYYINEQKERTDKYSKDILQCDFYNLYETKAKKEEMLGRSPSAVGVNTSNTVPSLSISIADLLQNVKDVKLVTSVLSKMFVKN